MNIVQEIKDALDTGSAKDVRKLIPSLNKTELQKCLRHACNVRARDPIGTSNVCIIQDTDGDVLLYIKGVRHRNSVLNKGFMSFNYVKTFRDNVVAIFHNSLHLKRVILSKV